MNKNGHGPKPSVKLSYHTKLIEEAMKHVRKHYTA